MKKQIFSNLSFQKAYDESEFSIGDKVRIVNNSGVLKKYDEYIGTTATIIGVEKLTAFPWEPTENGLIGFRIDSDKYSKFKSGKRRFPYFAFWECEIEKV